jgi:hypothetical protein
MNRKGGLVVIIRPPFFYTQPPYHIKNHHVLITFTRKTQKNIKKCLSLYLISKYLIDL